MSAAAEVPTNFPTGAWTLYYHGTDDQSWNEDSYKKVASYTDYASLWATFKAIGTEKFNNGMWFFMRNPHPPLWENHMNIRGGSYCIKVGQSLSYEIFQRYIAAATLDMVSRRPVENKIVGISISPKKGFHIIKVWNANGINDDIKDLTLLDDTLLAKDVLYRPNVNQRM